ncbi:unnamed protein product [Acanthoscelides obtectus]|uniref:Uncharacterized protein n=1 Tax=Acanthoscelides obtectus TaxID=200917 RepID=A0A9P0KUI0_ACAOB|nr:unnamed protein product [Acanthoscelides obtectus]CAK1633745.1 hypothetical protein AOBTE_LOCUS8357 [Acanthoscelides obtectus]
MTEVDAVATRAALRPSSSVLHTHEILLQPGTKEENTDEGGNFTKEKDAEWKKYERLKRTTRREGKS